MRDVGVENTTSDRGFFGKLHDLLSSLGPAVLMVETLHCWTP